VVRRIIGPKGEKVVGGWRRLHNAELRNLYTSPNIIKVIKSRRVSWAQYVARMGEMRNAYSILVGKPEGRHHSEYIDVEGRKILEWMLWQGGWRVWTGCIWLRIGACGGLS
jgi:hypothetical protein